MDTVILAAGRGARLRGVAAPFHKPFMVINGRALIVNAVELALSTTTGRVFVIAAPGNVVPMIDLIHDAIRPSNRLRYLVQPEPTGPGAAFQLASDGLVTDQMMVLLADNVLTEGDLRRCLDAALESRLVIGYRKIQDERVAAHFTRIGPSLSIRETPDVLEDERWDDDTFHCWVGPLIVPTDEMRAALADAEFMEDVTPEHELKLGRHLGGVQYEPSLVLVGAYDVGDPAVVEDI